MSPITFDVPPPYIIVVTGWRKADVIRHGPFIRDKIRYHVYQRHQGVSVDGGVLLRHGACPLGGVDFIAEKFAQSLGWQVEPFVAQRVGRYFDGPTRNGLMVRAQPRAAICLAFPGPRDGAKRLGGTRDCLNQAIDAGLTTFVYPLVSVG